MAEDWDAVAGEVADALSEINAGQTLVSAVVRRTMATGGTDWEPTGETTVSVSASVIFSEYSSDEIDGTTVLATDTKLLMASSGFSIAARPDGSGLNTVDSGDEITVNGVRYKIVSVQALRPAGTVLLLELQCRAS